MPDEQADTALVRSARRLRRSSRDLNAVLAAGSRRSPAVIATTPCAGRSYGQHAAPSPSASRWRYGSPAIAEAAEQLPSLRLRALTGLARRTGRHARRARRQRLGIGRAFAAELGLAAAPIAWHSSGRAWPRRAHGWRRSSARSPKSERTSRISPRPRSASRTAHVPGRGGSSAMPHKRNPVSATVILAACLGRRSTWARRRA